MNGGIGGQAGLQGGGKVTIIGGGIAGAAMAAALLFTARARGRSLDVRVYAGDRDPGAHRPPVILAAECRSRLAALGCRIPPDWRALELDGVEVIAGAARARLRATSGPLWVVDAWPEGDSGRVLIARGIAQVASQHGAQFVGRPVQRVEITGRRPRDPATQAGAGSLVIWSQGANERAHAAVLACGTSSDVAARFFDGFEGAPTLSAAHARLRCPSLTHRPWNAARLILAPLPGVDALYLVPCRGTMYALGVGPSVEPADLCQALMVAARDGYLPEGFEIAHLSPTRVPAGAGRRLCAPGQLTVGAAALGHPLQLTLSETLATCSRAAVALVDGAARRDLLERRFVREGLFDLVEDARAATKALRHLARAGTRAPEVLARTYERGLREPHWGSGVLGLSTPTPTQLLPRARRAAFVHALTGWWQRAIVPLPPVLPRVERELYYVVDDDPELREALTDWLKTRGAEVVAFADELALFCAAARRRPTAILLDVVLNWVDGLRLCEALKHHPLTRDTKVVVMSGLNRPFVRERALAAGAEAFLPKPVTPERLFSALDPAPEPSRPSRPAAPAYLGSGLNAS